MSLGSVYTLQLCVPGRQCQLPSFNVFETTFYKYRCGFNRGGKGSFHYAVIFTIDPLGLFVVSTLFSTMNLSGRDSVEHLEC